LSLHSVIYSYIIKIMRSYISFTTIKQHYRRLSIDDSATFATMLRNWAEDKLPKYGIPSLLKIVPKIPRSMSGTINKKDLVEEVFATDSNEAPDQLSRFT